MKTTRRWSPGELLVLLDQGRHVLDGAGGLRAAQQVEVGPVAVDALERRAQAWVGAKVGVLAAGRHPRAQDLLAHVDELHAAAAAGQAGQHRLLGDDAVEQVLLVVLEADVEHAGKAAHHDVAGHLHGHGGLAGALGAADEQHLAGSDAAADGLVQRREAERDRLVLRDVALGDLAGQGRKHLGAASGLDAAESGVVLPGFAADGLIGGGDGTGLLRGQRRLSQAAGRGRWSARWGWARPGRARPSVVAPAAALAAAALAVAAPRRAVGAEAGSGPRPRAHRHPRTQGRPPHSDRGAGRRWDRGRQGMS